MDSPRHLNVRLFLILDTKTGRYYQGDTQYNPWISNAFTDSFNHARLFVTPEDAGRLVENFSRTRYEFDGNTRIAPDRLKVMEIVLTPAF